MGKKAPGGGRKLTWAPFSIVLFLVISSQDPLNAPEEGEVRMCRDRHSPRQKEDGHSELKIIRSEGTCRAHLLLPGQLGFPWQPLPRYTSC